MKTYGGSKRGHKCSVELVASLDRVRNLKANGRTGLTHADVFSFGNLIGDTGGAGNDLRVDARDLTLTRANLGRSGAAALGRYDFDRNGRIDAVDLALVRSNVGRSLRPPQVTLAAPAAAPYVPPRREPARRTSLWYESIAGTMPE